MKFIKNGFKVLLDYCIILFVFGLLFIVFLQITGGQYSTWIPIYSFLFFLLFVVLLYGDMASLAEKEKRPQSDIEPRPFNGLLYGIIGTIPVVLVEMILYFVKLQLSEADILVEKVMKTLLGPIYWMARAGGLSVCGYIIMFISVPLLAMLSYMAGYYNVKPFGFLNKTEVKPKGFVKSDWNPSKKNTNTKKKNSKKTGLDAQGGTKGVQ